MITIEEAYNKYYKTWFENNWKRLKTAQFYTSEPYLVFKLLNPICENEISDKNKMTPLFKWMLWLIIHQKQYNIFEDKYKLTYPTTAGYYDIFVTLKKKRIISGKNADIFNYKSIAELGKFVNQYKNLINDLSNNQFRKICEKNKNNIIKYYEDDEWLILSPKSYEAACYWGTNTQWCTATRSTDKHYKNYITKGPLYININKKCNTKYQFHFETMSFMDEDDISSIPLTIWEKLFLLPPYNDILDDDFKSFIIEAKYLGRNYNIIKDNIIIYDDTLYGIENESYIVDVRKKKILWKGKIDRNNHTFQHKENLLFFNGKYFDVYKSQFVFENDIPIDVNFRTNKQFTVLYNNFNNYDDCDITFLKGKQIKQVIDDEPYIYLVTNDNKLYDNKGLQLLKELGNNVKYLEHAVMVNGTKFNIFNGYISIAKPFIYEGIVIGHIYEPYIEHKMRKEMFNIYKVQDYYV